MSSSTWIIVIILVLVVVAVLYVRSALQVQTRFRDKVTEIENYCHSTRRRVIEYRLRVSADRPVDPREISRLYDEVEFFIPHSIENFRNFGLDNRPEVIELIQNLERLRREVGELKIENEELLRVMRNPESN